MRNMVENGDVGMWRRTVMWNLVENVSVSAVTY